MKCTHENMEKYAEQLLRVISKLTGIHPKKEYRDTQIKQALQNLERNPETLRELDLFSIGNDSIEIRNHIPEETLRTATLVVDLAKPEIKGLCLTQFARNSTSIRFKLKGKTPLADILYKHVKAQQLNIKQEKVQQLNIKQEKLSKKRNKDAYYIYNYRYGATQSGGYENAITYITSKFIEPEIIRTHLSKELNTPVKVPIPNLAGELETRWNIFGTYGGFSTSSTFNVIYRDMLKVESKTVINSPSKVYYACIDENNNFKSVKVIYSFAKASFVRQFVRDILEQSPEQTEQKLFSQM